MIGDELILINWFSVRIAKLKKKKISLFTFNKYYVNKILAKNNIPVRTLTYYSPDLTHCDYFLFPKIKAHLRRCCLGKIEKMQQIEWRQCQLKTSSSISRCSTSQIDTEFGNA